MNKNKAVLAIAAIAVTAISSALYIISSQEKSNQSKKDNPFNTSPVISQSAAEINNNNISPYSEYSDNIMGSVSDKKRVLFFYANWCPTCIPVDNEFKTNLKQIPEDLSIIRVNYNDTETDNEEKKLAEKYSITYQHTFVQIDGNGNEITKWNGGGFSELRRNIK